MNRMTDRCKNITLPQTSFAGGKKAMRGLGSIPTGGNILSLDFFLFFFVFTQKRRK